MYLVYLKVGRVQFKTKNVPKKDANMVLCDIGHLSLNQKVAYQLFGPRFGVNVLDTLDLHLRIKRAFINIYLTFFPFKNNA